MVGFRRRCALCPSGAAGLRCPLVTFLSRDTHPKVNEGESAVERPSALRVVEVLTTTRETGIFAAPLRVNQPGLLGVPLRGMCVLKGRGARGLPHVLPSTEEPQGRVRYVLGGDAKLLEHGLAGRRGPKA